MTPSTSPEVTIHHAKEQTQLWFERVVLGLNLCPFAHRPAKKNSIRFLVSGCKDEDALLSEIIKELEHLNSTPISICETTLIITPYLLGDFYHYQFFLTEVQRQLKNHNWLGVFQCASFHPDYCFMGTEPSEPSNLTNQSPYPIIHLLREASLSEVLENVKQPEDIPKHNIETVSQLSDLDKKHLFPYLKHLKK